MKDSSPNFRNLVAFLTLLARYRDENISIYNAMAPGYDRFAEEWDEFFAHNALNSLFVQLADSVPEGGLILDAGCGTGRHISDLISWTAPSKIVGLDISEPMLNMARRRGGDSRVEYVRGNLSKLPFPDNSFDAVVALWVLETMHFPARAVQEFLRVIKPGGMVAYTFVQIPDQTDDAEALLGNAFLHADPAVREALSPGKVPYHDCDRSTLSTFRHGLITTVTLGKCCSVSSDMLPL